MKLLAQFVFATLALALASTVHAQGVHGVLRVVKGDVQIKSAQSGQTVKGRLGEKVYPKDVIITGKDARAKIVMIDKNEINVSPDSQVEIQNYEYTADNGKKDVLLNVIYGKVRSKVEQKYDGKNSKFQIKTNSAIAGVRGTDFLMSFSRANNQSQVVTFEGKVEFGVPGPNGAIANPVMVEPGKQASISAGQAAPTPPREVPKEELNKMEQETKSEAPRGNESGDPRNASGDSDKKEEKKEAAEKDAGAKEADKGDKADKSEGDKAKAERAERADSDGDKAKADGDKPKADGDKPKADGDKGKNEGSRSASGGDGDKGKNEGNRSASGRDGGARADSNSGDRSSPSGGGGSNESGGTSASGGSRGPASVGPNSDSGSASGSPAPTAAQPPPAPAPASGSMIRADDLATTPVTNAIIPTPTTSTGNIPLPINSGQNPCGDFCTRVIEEGSTRLIIRVQ